MKIPKIENLKAGNMGPNNIRKNYPEFYEMIINKKYPKDLSFSEKLYWWFNNIKDYPKCKCCNNKVKYINIKNGYAKYCSKKCSNSDFNKKELTKKICQEKYGGNAPACSKEVQDKMKSTMLERYGVDNALKNEDIKSKVFNTIKEKYGGIGNASQYIKEKYIEACLERYGVDNVMKDQIIQEKLKQTLFEKYGVNSPFQIDEVKEKIKNILIERYGVEHPYQSKDILNKMHNTCLEKYGVDWPCQRKEARNFSNDSKPNRDFCKLLDNNNIEYEREFTIDKYSFDFKIGDILVEINPSATHNSTWGIFSKKPLDKNYHLNKSEYAKKNGFRCLHIWDWDDTNKIINLLKDRITIGARECVIKEINKKECNEFLNTYHLQNTCNGQKVRLGLYYKDELVEVMTFGIPRYNKSYDWELLRLCTNDNYNIIGGAGKLFKYFKDIYKPKSIISYCDNSKFDGKVYKTLGFSLIRNKKPSKHWYSIKLKKHITDNLLKQRGYDALFGTNYGKGTSNIKLMISNGFVEVYDCGQSTYVLKLD